MISIYADLTSQPSRAILALMTIENDKIGPWEWKKVDLGKQEHKKPEMMKLNPSLKVPAMIEKKENGEEFMLFESHAIMKYICTKKNLPEHWYPRKPENLEL